MRAIYCLVWYIFILILLISFGWGGYGEDLTEPSLYGSIFVCEERLIDLAVIINQSSAT
jgi:hypothetical protein